MPETIFDDHEVTLTCPECGQEIPQTIGQLKTNPNLECPGCGRAIKVDADQMNRELDNVQREIDP